MRVFRPLLAALAAVLLLPLAAHAQAPTLMISELCDPRSNYQNNRYIEIFNPTSQAINLQGWKVQAVGNGSVCHTWNLTGTIQPNQAMTCGGTNASAGLNITFASSGWTVSSGTCAFNWNGQARDGARLLDPNNNVVDDVQPGTGTTSTFADGVLVRNAPLCRGSSTFNASEWTFTSVSNAGTAPSTPNVHTSTKDSCCRGNLPTLATNGPRCADQGITITRAGVPDTHFVWYWQTSPTGTDTTDSAATRTVFAADTVYIRAYDSTKNCWDSRYDSALAQALPAPPAPDTPRQNGPQCASEGVTLRWAAGARPPAGVRWHWLSTDTATNPAAPADSVHTVYTPGLHYLRGRDTATTCWGPPVGVFVEVDSGPRVPPTPMMEAPACDTTGTLLRREPVTPIGVSWFWQTDSMGRDTVHAQDTFRVFATGTYYLRAKAAGSPCWSLGAASVDAEVLNCDSTLSRHGAQPTPALRVWADGPGRLAVETSAPPTTHLALFDAQGRTLLQTSLQQLAAWGTRYSLHLPTGLPRGTYLLQVGQHSQRLMLVD